MSENSIKVVASNKSLSEFIEQEEQILVTDSHENEEETIKIPSETDKEDFTQQNSEEQEGYDETEINEVNLEDEGPVTEIILDHETIPETDLISKSSVTESELYYSQSYEGSQRDLDKYIDMEERIIPEEEENEEYEEIEIAVNSMTEPSLNSEPKDEYEGTEEQDVENENKENIRVSTSSQTSEVRFSRDEHEVADIGESDTGDVDEFHQISEEELEDVKEDEKAEPESKDYEPESKLDSAAERISLICEELGPILDIIVVIEGKETLRTSFGVFSPIKHVKIRLAPIFHLKPDEIDLFHGESICRDESQLSEFGIMPPETLFLQVKARDPDYDILSNDYLHYTPLIDIISARISLTGGYFEDKLMQIESDCFVKEWLGGFKNNKTNKEYHNVQTQTLPRIYNLPRGVVLPPRFTRQTQTPVFPLVDEGIASPESKGTQVWRSDFYVQNCSDKIIIAKPGRFKQVAINSLRKNLYTPILHFSTLVNVVVVFKRFKKLLEKMVCKRSRASTCLPQVKTGQQKINDELVREEQRKMIINMFYPTTRFDFSMVYLLVSKWRHKETKLIDQLKTNESRKAAYIMLLKKEVDMIWTIEKQRLSVKMEALKRNNQAFLEKAAHLKTTKHFNSIDSLETQQAKEYMDIYTTLTRRDVTIEQRLDILHHFRNIILSIAPEEGVDNLVKLVDRECDLLQIGLKRGQLEVLRQRIEQQTLECLRNNLIQPEFRLTYTEKTPRKSVQAKFRCSKCRVLKACSDYNVHLKVTNFSICYSCEWLMHIGYQRLDLSPYLRILETTRKSEMSLHTNSGASYILQVTGMWFLVNNIWLGKSALSENSDVTNLRMTRWKPKEDWTPWNCILLTQEEARIHMEIPDVEEYYAKPLVDSIYLKHKRARYHFFLLYISDVYIKKTGLWYNVI